MPEDNYFDSHDLTLLDKKIISFDPAAPVTTAVEHKAYFDNTSKMFLIPDFPDKGTHYEAMQLPPDGTYQLTLSDENYQNEQVDPRHFNITS